MLDKIVVFNLLNTEWGDIKILQPIPTADDAWGVLSPVRDTPWGSLIPVVSGMDYSDAMHGHVTPLMRTIGNPPQALLKLIPLTIRLCSQSKACLNFQAQACFPCPSMPDCYMAPGLTDKALEGVNLVLQAWRDGVYVVVVDGLEFT